ncbi:HK97 family phage prohead protease [Hymenobacter guriensis]|uniref:HK97 family phage prohead protease n=1 Tax=Hymenobacter guriensis TaxID=2793065 RepID=A0ABS0KWV6_9BACT|nr:HK97 family phage prohead protease [Hymenobacter guriensis]MBG8552349.1 HK97 family phage prohead protease [Hymenobacter guriensis]
MKPTLPTNSAEIRFAAGTLSVERRANENTPEAFVGKAIVCGSRSKNMGGFVEVIDPKALDSADMSDVVGLFNHNRDILLGRSTSGSLTLTRDADGGLSYRIAYDPNDPDHTRLLAKFERGDVVGSSFAFTTARNGEEWQEEETEGGGILYVRTVTAIKKIYDVSPVTDPAYADSTAAKRSLEHFKQEHPDARMKGMKMPKKKGKRDETAAELAERAFLEAMIPHHEMALEMASTALKEAETPDIRAFAQGIIDGQGGEINQMKQWLSDMDTAERQSPDAETLRMAEEHAFFSSL